MAPANASVLLFGAATWDQGALVAGTGFTTIQANGGSITEQDIPTSPNNTLQRATAGPPIPTPGGGNWITQLAVFRAASWYVANGWSPERTAEVINAGQYPGSDPCIQAQNAESGNSGANVIFPIVGTGEAAQAPCSVDPLSGFTSGNSGVLKITNLGANANVVLAMDGPIHQTGTSLIAEPQRASDNGGVMLAASSAFGTLAAHRIFTSGISVNLDTSATTCGTGGTTQCPCYIVSYADPTYKYVIRGTEPGIQFSGFTATGLSSLNSLPRRAIAGNGNDVGPSFHWGDSFCVDSGASYAEGPTEGGGTATFKIYAPDIPTSFAGCGGGLGTCGGSAQITAWTYMVYQGHAPTDSVNSGTCGSGGNDQYCALTLQGQPAPGTNITQGATLKNIGLTANAYPGVAAVACIFCEEGSAWDNDSSVVVRVPGPAYAVWSGGAQTPANFPPGGNSSQNFTGARRIEDYCNESTWPGDKMGYTCWSAANYARVAFILNDNWGRLGLTDVTTNTCSSNTGGPCPSGKQNPNPAVMIDGISAPASKGLPSGASGPMRIGPIHAQSWPSLFLIGSQEPTKDVEIDGPHVNATGANYAVHISCNFHSGATCKASNQPTPNGPGNRTSDITVMHANGGGNATIWDEFENASSMTDCPTANVSSTTKGCWQDNSIAFWAMTNCVSDAGGGNASSCFGPGVSVITTSNQFPNRFAGGLELTAGAHVGTTAANTDFSGTCTLGSTSCSITFVNPFVSNPVCTVAWESGTLTGILKAAVSTTTLTITSTVGTDSGVVGYICAGNPN